MKGEGTPFDFAQDRRLALPGLLLLNAAIGVYPTIVGISDWYLCTARTRSVILSRSAAEAKNLAVHLEERDSSSLRSSE
jgi:hypothetical protein